MNLVLKQIVSGFLGILSSTKAFVVISIFIATFVALVTKRLDSSHFSQMWIVILPSWLGTHMAQSIWGNDDNPPMGIGPATPPGTTTSSTTVVESTVQVNAPSLPVNAQLADQSVDSTHLSSRGQL